MLLPDFHCELKGERAHVSYLLLELQEIFEYDFVENSVSIAIYNFVDSLFIL